MTATRREQTVAGTFLPLYDSSDELMVLVDAEPSANWTFGVGSGARVVVTALLDLVREEAQRG